MAQPPPSYKYIACRSGFLDTYSNFIQNAFSRGGEGRILLPCRFTNLVMHYLWWKARLPGSCSQCASHSLDRPAMGAHCQKSCIMPTVNSYVFENIPYVCKSIIFFDQWLTISFISESVTEIQNRYMHLASTSPFWMQFPNSIHMTRILLLLKSLMKKCIVVPLISLCSTCQREKV